MIQGCGALVILLLLGLSQGCHPLEIIDPPGIEVNMETDSTRFAIIGDYGKAGTDAEAVARMVKGWDPDFILTTGDNNYEHGDYSTLEANIGSYYGDYIYNFDAPEEYQCRGRAFRDRVNRFFPSPGNHDEAGARDLEPYLNYFTLPGQEEYYTFSWGPAKFYSINSLSSADHELQQEWLQKELESSDRSFNIVYFHHPPYSPGNHGDTPYMQWDFFEWGADAVISGHDHIYAHLQKSDEPDLHYIINGLGGRSKYSCEGASFDPAVTVLNCYNLNFGAMHCTLTPEKLEMVFYSIQDPQHPVEIIYLLK